MVNEPPVPTRCANINLSPNHEIGREPHRRPPVAILKSAKRAGTFIITLGPTNGR